MDQIEKENLTKESKINSIDEKFDKLLFSCTMWKVDKDDSRLVKFMPKDLSFSEIDKFVQEEFEYEYLVNLMGDIVPPNN